MPQSLVFLGVFSLCADLAAILLAKLKLLRSLRCDPSRVIFQMSDLENQMTCCVFTLIWDDTYTAYACKTIHHQD